MDTLGEEIGKEVETFHSTVGDVKAEVLLNKVVVGRFFFFITGSLKVSTKASVSIVVTSLPIGLTCTSVSLATNVFISA